MSAAVRRAGRLSPPTTILGRSRVPRQQKMTTNLGGRSIRRVGMEPVRICLALSVRLFGIECTSTRCANSVLLILLAGNCVFQ
jgi:hypothetical protein